MKKLLIALIAVLTILAITLTIVAGSVLAKRNQKEEPKETVSVTEAITEAFTEAVTEAVTEAPTQETIEETTAPTVSTIVKETAATETTLPPAEPGIFDGMEFRPMSRTVYATQRVNIRKLPKVKSDLIGKLEKDSAVEQIGLSKDNKWSRIIYKDQKCFVATEYLTTKKPDVKEEPTHDPMPEIQKVNDTVYSTGSLNVRSGPGTDYNAIGFLKKGDKTDRVGIADNGWSKIRYNSGYGYVSSKYLSREDPDPDYTMVNETVYATDNLNLRAGPSTDHKVSAKLLKGQSVLRTAVGDNGWSEVKFEGSILYASSKYLTTTAPEGAAKPTQPEEKPNEPTLPQKPALPDCKTVDETMYATQSLIIYSGPGTSYENLGSISQGKLLQRTGIYENGWSRILLGGKEVCVVSAYLTDKKPESNPPAKPENQEPPKEESQKEENDGYVENAKTVYSTGDNVNVRVSPHTNADKLGQLSKGDSVDRLAIGDDGWSRVLFKEQKAYVSSVFLTEEQKPQKDELEKPITETFKDVEETIYAIDDVTVRLQPSIDAEALGTLYYGYMLQRTGIGTNWSRINWDGQTAYVYSKYISLEEPEMPDFGETTTPGFPTPNSPFIYQYLDMEGLIPHAVFSPVEGSSDKPLPLIISLHGSAEVGKSRDEFEQFHLTKVFREWEYTKLNPIEAVVVCPHIGKEAGFTQWGSKAGADAIFKLIDDLTANYNIDKNRIILEGHSMGGQGALYIAADSRAKFQKLVIVSGYGNGVDYSKISIPVYGCVGGDPNGSGPKDLKDIYNFMTVPFKTQFGEENLYVGPYTHDDVAIQFFQKDENKDGVSDIIDWMLK